MGYGVEIFGVLSGIIYLILEIKQNKFMWVVGVISALAYIFLFWESNLYGAMLLQFYYLIISVFGLYKWIETKRLEGVGDGGEKVYEIFYRIPSLSVCLLSTLVAGLLFLFLYFFLGKFSSDSFPLMDSITTALSIIATYWLSKLYREQWLIWVIVNVITLIMCLKSELYLSSMLYFVYTLSAIYGYWHWWKKGKKI
jgi:nicotinamide mononucleotide transporter PnuC